MSDAVRARTPSGWPARLAGHRYRRAAVALGRGTQHAAEAGAEVADRIDWHQEDVLSWGPEYASFDLISSQFMHLPPEPREALFRRLADGVAPGGTLLIVGHHPSDLQPSVARGALPELRYTASEVAALLGREEWEILVEAAPERSVTDPAGETVTIHDAVCGPPARITFGCNRAVDTERPGLAQRGAEATARRFRTPASNDQGGVGSPPGDPGAPLGAVSFHPNALRPSRCGGRFEFPARWRRRV